MNNDWKFDVYYLQGLLQQTFTNANDSYEALSNYDGNAKYLIAVNLLGMSYQSYLVALQFHQSNKDIQRGEFEDFFKAYENFKFEMNKVISKKDTNTSWMVSRLDQFNSSMFEVNKLIENIQGTSNYE